MNKQRNDNFAFIEEMKINLTDLPKYCRALLEANFDPEIIFEAISSNLCYLGCNHEDRNFGIKYLNDVAREFIPYLNPSQLLNSIVWCLHDAENGSIEDFIGLYRDGLIARPDDSSRLLNYTLHPAEYFLACIAYRTNDAYENFNDLLGKLSIEINDLLSHLDDKWLDVIIYCESEDDCNFYDSLVEYEQESLSQPSVRLTKFMEYFASAGGNLENFALIFTKNFDPDINSYFRANKKNYIKALRQALLDAGVSKKIVAQI